MDINKLREEYNNQDNRGTRWPIKVLVKSLEEVGILENYNDVQYDKIEAVYSHPTYHPSWSDDVVKVSDAITTKMDDEYNCTTLDKMVAYEIDCEIIHKYRVWAYREVKASPFLTVKAAKEYIERDAKNLFEPKHHIDCISLENHEMIALMEELGLKTSG